MEAHLNTVDAMKLLSQASRPGSRVTSPPKTSRSKLHDIASLTFLSWLKAACSAANSHFMHRPLLFCQTLRLPQKW